MLINCACGFTSISVVWFGYVQDTLIEENITACSGTTYIDDRWKRSLRSAGGAIDRPATWRPVDEAADVIQLWRAVAVANAPAPFC